MNPPSQDRPRGLGRGLSALIGDEAAAVKGEPVARKDVRTLPVAFLQPGKYQPRHVFDDEPLEALAASIKEVGVLSPILVRPIGPDRYEIVAGERRWRAAQLAKLHDVPVLVRELKDEQALEIAIIENVQREGLNAIEEAKAYQDLIEKFGRTQEEVAKQVGKSRPHVANTIRLLKLPAQVRAWVEEGKLTAGHARTLLGVPDPEAMARELMEGGLTVRQSERRSEARKHPGKPAPRDPNIVDLESSVSNALGLTVHITHRVDKAGDKGEVKIAYSSFEQLDDLIRRLKTAR
jgi:ParB family transcriptional regulator, chromosome partitioning protein